jgi:ribose transport system ATP-binding protein
VRNGEVAGLVALEGQGQDELFAALSGSIRPSAGTIAVDGKPMQFASPADAIAAGIAYVPGDRTDALLMQRSVRENIALPFSARMKRWGPIDMRGERRRVAAAIERLQIDTRAQREVQRLSGGNQQKVTIARWIAAEARTILCFDPTRGIDVRTKQEIYRLLRELAGQGASVLYYTSELEEVQLVCDRAIVIFSGRVVDILPAELADEAALTRAAYGLPREARAAVGVLADPSAPPPAAGAA